MKDVPCCMHAVMGNLCNCRAERPRSNSLLIDGLSVLIRKYEMALNGYNRRADKATTGGQYEAEQKNGAKVLSHVLREMRQLSEQHT